MTVVLAIAVLALVAALLYVLLGRKEEVPVAEPVDVRAAVQEATSAAVADLQRMNE